MKINQQFFYFICLLLFSCGQESLTTPAALADSFQEKEEISYYDFSDSVLTHRIDTFFQKRFRAKRFNGVALFAKGDKIVYHKAFGLADFKTQRPLDRNAPFQLASVSKPLTALAILQLSEQGKLMLDDSVTQYFPDFPYINITIRHLLSHRSGLPNYMYFVDQVWEDKYQTVSNQEVIDIMIRDTPKAYYSPNVRYHYCNTNYALLASIVEKVTNQPFEAYMQEAIFDVVGMDSSFIFNKNITPNLPQTVIGHNARYQPKDNTYQNGVVGDKGTYASAIDLFKLDRALTNNLLLDQNTLIQAHIPYSPRLSRINRDNYGLGWRIQANPEFGKVVYHSGWWKGFKTYFIRMLDKDQTIVVLTNVTKGGYLNRIAMQGLLE